MSTGTVMRTAIVHEGADVAYRALLDLDVRAVCRPLLAAADGLRHPGPAPAAPQMRPGDLPATHPDVGLPLVRLRERPGREFAFGFTDGPVAARLAAVPAAERRCVLVYEV